MARLTDQELQSKIRKLDNSKAKIIALDNTMKQIGKDEEVLHGN